jgi:hypothetical protein
MLLGGRGADADLLVPKSGPKVRGRIVKETDAEVVFNPYWSPNEKMTWEVVRLPRDQVKKLEVEPHPEPEFYRRLHAAKPDDAAAFTALAEWAKAQKLKAHVEMATTLATAATQRKAVAAGSPPSPDAPPEVRYAELRGPEHVAANPLLAQALAEYIGADDAKRKALAKLFAERVPAYAETVLERMRRSAALPKGRTVDVPLSVHADRYPGATYTMFVPKAYDATRPWPLLIGLHGGGPDGKARDEVVGSGDSAMNFYEQEAERRGVLVACPDALVAPWGEPTNEAFVRDLLVELRLLYHVDVDRVHLTGHSMGGYGTWSLGPKMADLFATISPMAGAGSGGVSKLVETKTPIFIYHSADDFIDVNPDRQAARQLRDSELDFIYTELDGEGHGYPDAIRLELFDFLLPRRNFDPKVKDAWPRSSFLGKTTPEEKTYLGDPLEALGEAPALADLVGRLRLGGMRARTAATLLGEKKPEGAGEAVAKVLKDEKVPPHARAEAARAAGRLGEAGLPAAAALRKAVAAPATLEASGLVAAAAEALALVKDPEAGEALEKGLAAWILYFEDKQMGSGMRFSDWERSLGALTALAAAWGGCGAKGAVGPLEKGVVARVLGRTTKVETSERVPQDPGVAFRALAKAVAACFAAAKAPDAAWDALQKACGSDTKAQADVTAARKGA